MDRSVFEVPEPSSRGSQKTANQQAGSDNNKMRAERHSIQEEGMSHAAAEPLRKSINFQLQNKMEMTEDRHDGAGISSKLHIQEKSVATNSTKKQQSAVPIMCNSIQKKDHSSKPTTSDSGETLLSSSFTSSDKTSELKPNTLVRALSERQQERPNEQSSKTIKSRSVGADRKSPHIIVLAQETKDNSTPLISELEEHETKNGEQSLLNIVAVGRELTSNVQVCSDLSYSLTWPLEAQTHW